MKEIKKRKLKMKFAGRFIDLLGHQMYGGPVPAVAEFIANAWDADAKKVEISIPEDPNKPGAEIVIKDFGEGMTFDELDDFYLNIGYQRRKTRGEKTKNGRFVMGRKGIGKLAGFGVAEDIILRSVKDSRIIEFKLSYNELKSKRELNDFEFFPDIDEPTNGKNGVTVILRNLKIEKKINIESFRKSIGRRFALNTDEMSIEINGKILTKENLEFEFKLIQEDGEWLEEEIDDFGKVRYWFGFLRNTIKEPELRGVSVFARKRMAQGTPFFFNLSGGIHGQVGLEYLTGQVEADDLDKDTDYIATDRHSINWQFDKAPRFEEWGQKKIKDLCKSWKKRKDERNLDKFKHDYSEFFLRINALSSQEKKDITAALEKIAGLERIEGDDFKIIAHSMIEGVERESVKKVIKSINSVSENALPELYEAIKEWDIISAVSSAEVISGKIEIIKKFKRYIDEKLPEKTPKGQLDMQDFIKEHPWLLGHEYETLKPADFHHERGVDKWIEEVLKETDKEFSSQNKREGRRFDLLCIKNEWQIIILELMKPGKKIDYDHLMRLNRYVTKIRSAIKGSGTVRDFQNKNTFGLLIADRIDEDPSLTGEFKTLEKNLDVITWGGLFKKVEARYRDFMDILRMKAPDDPRIQGLINLD